MTKDTFKLFSKNLNFIPTFKTNKQNVYFEIESFFTLAKLKPYFKDQYNEKLNTEDQIFKPQSKKNGHLIKTMAPSKHTLKQRTENLNNREISVTIKDTATYLKMKELL